MTTDLVPLTAYGNGVPDIAGQDTPALVSAGHSGMTNAQERAEREEWLEQGRALYNAGNRLPWAAGDWYIAGARYGNAAELAESIGWNIATLQRAAYVCRKFPQIGGAPPIRSLALPFRHFEAVRSLPLPEATALLEQALREGLTSDDLRDEVRRLSGPDNALLESSEPGAIGISDFIATVKTIRDNASRVNLAAGGYAVVKETIELLTELVARYEANRAAA